MPKTLDPALAPDLPSLNVSLELYAGLTRFSGTGVIPDLAESWDVDQGGLVWTFHLRKGIHWNDGRAISAADFRRAWVRALDPRTKAPFSGPELGIVRGARRFQATGQGSIGVEAVDSRTLRVTLQHPVPWFDQLTAFPVSFPFRRDAFSGPFRLRSTWVLERNREYWNAAAVKPARLALGTDTNRADVILPRGLAAPGLPWIETARPPPGPGWRKLPTLSVHLLWLVTKRPELASDLDRVAIAVSLEDAFLNRFVPDAMPGRREIVSYGAAVAGVLTPRELTLAYTAQDAAAPAAVRDIQSRLGAHGVTVRPISFPTLRALEAAASPPARPDIDMVLLGWSPKIFDEYNIFDLFPCGSAFNVAQWCDPEYDALMRRAVRTLDAHARRRIERELLSKQLQPSAPAVPLGGQSEYVRLKPGVRGFSWSPIGFYELSGLTRS
jgi:ABC-type transport system substrate-binding protein